MRSRRSRTSSSRSVRHALAGDPRRGTTTASCACRRRTSTAVRAPGRLTSGSPRAVRRSTSSGRGSSSCAPRGRATTGPRPERARTSSTPRGSPRHTGWRPAGRRSCARTAWSPGGRGTADRDKIARALATALALEAVASAWRSLDPQSDFRDRSSIRAPLTSPLFETGTDPGGASGALADELRSFPRPSFGSRTSTTASELFPRGRDLCEGPVFVQPYEIRTRC